MLVAVDNEGTYHYGVSAIEKMVPNSGGNLFLLKVVLVKRNISEFPHEVTEKIHPNHFYDTYTYPFIQDDEIYINGIQVLEDCHKTGVSEVLFAFYAGEKPTETTSDETIIPSSQINAYIPDSGVVTITYKNVNYGVEYNVRARAVKNINNEILMIYFIAGVFENEEEYVASFN